MGDFQSKIGSEDWSPTGAPILTLSTIPEGEIWTCFVQNDLPNGFYEYIYQVTFDDTTVRQVADPCARYGGQGNNHSGFVIGGSTPAVNAVTALSSRKPLRDLSVYEIHPWDFTAEFRGVRAPFDAMRDKL